MELRSSFWAASQIVKDQVRGESTGGSSSRREGPGEGGRRLRGPPGHYQTCSSAESARPVLWVCDTPPVEIALGVLTLIAGIVVPIWLHRRAHPARQFRYRVVSTRALQGLYGANEMGVPVTVRVGDELVRDPHTFAIELWSTGRADVPSTSFDAGTPLIINVGARILPGTFANQAGHSSTVHFTQISDRELALSPQLLSRSLRVTLTGSTDAAPMVSIRNPLIDVDVLPEERRGSPSSNPPSAVPSSSEERRGSPGLSPSPAVASLPSTRHRPRISALLITNGLAVASALLITVGVIMLAVDPTRSSSSPGAATAGISLLVLGACVVSYIIIGLVGLIRLVGLALVRRT